MSDHEDADHLANLSDGAGCAEVWEHLSEQREKDAADADSESDAESESADAETADADCDSDAGQDATEVPCP